MKTSSSSPNRPVNALVAESLIAILPSARSEQEFEMSLHDPLITGAAKSSKRRGITDIRRQAGPCVTIEQIENLHAQFEFETLVDWKLLQDREILVQSPAASRAW